MDLLTTAKALVERLETEATQANVSVPICLIDIHGNLVLQHSVSGAPAYSVELSECEAYASALVRMGTADVVPFMQPGQPLFPLLTVFGGCYSAIEGRVPLWREGQVVAGVGVSGGATEQDIAIVEAALR